MVWLGVAVVLTSALTATDVRVDSLAALREAASKAKPGDRIVLASGVYQGRLTLSGVRGEKDRPVVITGAVRQTRRRSVERASAFTCRSPRL